MSVRMKVWGEITSLTSIYLYSLSHWEMTLQWVSEIRAFWISYFKWSHLQRFRLAIPLALVMVQIIQQLDHSKYEHFCPGFECFLIKWRPFVRISNDWFQISDPILNPDHLQTNLILTIQTQTSQGLDTHTIRLVLITRMLEYWKANERTKVQAGSEWQALLKTDFS